MAVCAQDALAAARGLIGTPYAELDCINLIKKIIRTAPGGKKTYTTAGTNSLWKSADAAAKYRDLTWRQEGLAGARAGMLAFKARGGDWHHVGLATGEGTVIHSSSAQGGRGVVETPLTAREGWTHLAMHRHIKPAQEDGNIQAEGAKTAIKETAIIETEIIETEIMKTEGKGTVVTGGGKLNVRDEPYGKIIGTLQNGSEVEILGTKGDWMHVDFGEENTGYVFAAYIAQRYPKKRFIRITDASGDVYDLTDAFTVKVMEE